MKLSSAELYSLELNNKTYSSLSEYMPALKNTKNLVADVYVDGSDEVEHLLFSSLVRFIVSNGYLFASIDGSFSIDPPAHISCVEIIVHESGKLDSWVMSSRTYVNEFIESGDQNADLFFLVGNLSPYNEKRITIPDSKFRWLETTRLPSYKLEDLPTNDSIEVDNLPGSWTSGENNEHTLSVGSIQGASSTVKKVSLSKTATSHGVRAIFYGSDDSLIASLVYEIDDDYDLPSTISANELVECGIPYNKDGQIISEWSLSDYGIKLRGDFSFDDLPEDGEEPVELSTTKNTVITHDAVLASGSYTSKDKTFIVTAKEPNDSTITSYESMNGWKLTLNQAKLATDGNTIASPDDSIYGGSWSGGWTTNVTLKNDRDENVVSSFSASFTANDYVPGEGDETAVVTSSDPQEITNNPIDKYDDNIFIINAGTVLDNSSVGEYVVCNGDIYVDSLKSRSQVGPNGESAREGITITLSGGKNPSEDEWELSE